MSNSSFWNQVAIASSKWYLPANSEIIKKGELRPLDRQANTQDVVSIDYKPIIAYPSALIPKVVLGRNPLFLKGLFFTPLIIRLHYVAQLSTTNLRANVDAKHCRLSHALGTLSILSVIVEILVSRMRGDDSLYSKCKPSDREIVGAFTYAALHDAFQGPFGHALDLVREELVGGLHGERRLDKTLFSFILGSAIDHLEGRIQNPPLAIIALCHALNVGVAEPHKIPLLYLVKWVYDATVTDENSLSVDARVRRRELGWLYELLEGPVDADRWDYLWRDTLHLGFTRDNENVSRLLHEFWNDVSVFWSGDRSRLLVSQGLSEKLGDLFLLRRSLYRHVYENPEKRLIDGMLIRSIYSALLSSSGSPATWALQNQAHFEFVINLIHVTDSELLSILEQSEDPLLARLARELRTYPAVRVVWEYVIRDEEYRSTVGVQAEKLKGFGFKGVDPPKWALDSSKLDAELGEQVECVLEETYQRLRSRSRTDVVSLGSDELLPLLLHCAVLPIRAARVLQFERIVWKLVCNQLEGSPVLVKVVDSVLAAVTDPWMISFKPSREQIQDSLEKCPPFFIAFPWISGFSLMTMREMARDPASSRICVRFEDGRGVKDQSPADLMPRTDDSETYVAVGGYPFFVVSDLTEKEKELLDGTLNLAVKALVKFGCCLALPRSFVKEECDSYIVRFLLSQINKERELGRG